MLVAVWLCGCMAVWLHNSEWTSKRNRPKHIIDPKYKKDKAPWLLF